MAENYPETFLTDKLWSKIENFKLGIAILVSHCHRNFLFKKGIKYNRDACMWGPSIVPYDAERYQAVGLA